MSIKVPIRTVYDSSNNAIGLSEMQTGEAVSYLHGGTGLSSLGTTGQVLSVNSGADGLEFGDVSTLAGVSGYLQVTNANATFVTKTVALASNNALLNLINDRMQVANVQSLVTTSINDVIDAAPGTLDTLNELAAAIGDDANFITTINTSLGTKASNTYVNAQIGASNTNIRNYTDQTFVTKAIALTTNNAVVSLINDRIQVANAAATYSTLTQLGNTNSYIADVKNIALNRLGQTASITLTGDVTASGSFSANTISLTTDITASGTPTGTFGSASKVPIITVGADGRITNISNTNVAGVTGFTYTAANNTFAISTADGGTFTASVDELDNYALTSTVNAQIGASNTSIRQYINAEIGSSNTNIRTYTDTTYETKAVALAANTAQNSLILDRLQVANAASLFVNVSGDTMSGALAMGSNKITGLGTPTAGTDATTKTYVDNAVAGVVDSAPEALNTLNELAAALGDDANFATTTATTLGTKAANSYVNATFSTLTQLGNTNSYIATKADATTQVIAGSGLTGGGTLAANRTLNIGQGTGITVAADAISTNDSQIVHDNLSGFVANEHIDHSTVSITAGSGLTGGGTIAANRTINIGQGTGITVAADAISTNDGQIVHDNLSGFVANEHINHSSVTFTAGTGLTGGGTIAASRTFNVDVGTTANKIVQLDGSARLPAVDGSQLTGISAGATVTNKTDNVNYNIVFTNETSGTQSLAGIDVGAFTFNPSTGQCNATDFNSTSDVNLKDNIKTINSPLDKINQLRGVNFNWKNNGNYAMGVVAQEVESVIPEVVNETNGTKGVNYGAMVGLLIEVVKDQQKQIDELKQIINNV